MTDAAQPIRSPSYPNMSLAEAIEAVRKIEHNYRSSKVDRVAGAKLIGYSGLSGPANQALAALAQYGLVERAGKGEMRVTPRALAILHPDNDAEKMESLRQAAFEPALFAELHERYPNMLPPEDGVVTYLNRKGFNQNAIRPAVKSYLQTLLFLKEVGASESRGPEQRKAAESGQSTDGPKGPNFGVASIGDLVQWEIDGVLQMERPMRVRLIDTIDGRQYVAVEGSETGIPMDQVIVQERAAASPPDRPRFAIEAPKPKVEQGTTLPEGWKEERLIDDGGEEILIRYRGEPSLERYTFIRDYLDFKLSRMKKT
jgi:hypothetical protein